MFLLEVAQVAGMLCISSVPRNWLISLQLLEGAGCSLCSVCCCSASLRHFRELCWEGRICCWNIKYHLVAKPWFLNFHQPLHPKRSVPPSSAVSLSRELDFLSMQIFVRGKWFLSPKSFSHLGDGLCANQFQVKPTIAPLENVPTAEEKNQQNRRKGLSNRTLKAVERNCQTMIYWKP